MRAFDLSHERRVSDGTIWSETDQVIVSGHWIARYQEGVPSRLYADKTVLKILGVTEELCESPEKLYTIWQKNIFSSHIAEVQEKIQDALRGKLYDITYPWKSPSGETVFLRCVARRDMSCQDGYRMVGTLEDITRSVSDCVRDRQAHLKSDFILQILSDLFEAVHVLQFDRDNIVPLRTNMTLFWNEREMNIDRYKELLPAFVPDEDYEKLIQCIEAKKPVDENGDVHISYSWSFKSEVNHRAKWYNVLVTVDPTVSTETMVIAFRDITDLMEQEKKANYFKQTSEMDGLTQIYNRIAIENQVNTYINENPNGTGTVMLFDLDNFKSVNDLLGHLEGDNLLIETAAKLNELCCSTGKVGRLGGDEFVAFLPSVEEKEIETFAGQIIEKLKKAYRMPDKELEVTASVGIADYPRHGTSFMDLYHCADVALYDAKHRGKSCYSRYSGCL